MVASAISSMVTFWLSNGSEAPKPGVSGAIIKKSFDHISINGLYSSADFGD